MGLVLLVIFLVLCGVLANYVMQQGKGTVTKKSVAAVKSDAAFNFESPRLIQIIQESIEIINNTKNEKTALRRFDDVKRNGQRFFEILPEGRKINFQINGRDITSAADLYIIDEEKAKWSVNNEKVSKPPITDRFANARTMEDTASAIEVQAIQQWAGVFNKALADGKVSWEEMAELQTLQNYLGLTDEETKPYWAKVKTENLPVKQEVPTKQAEQSIEKMAVLPWVLTASFGKARSNSFQQVLSSVQIHPSFRATKGPNNEDIFEVDFLPEDVLNFEQLWLRIKEWKSTIIKIRGEIIDRASIAKWLICYRDELKTKRVNPLFCFGASSFTFNLFGCHRIRIRDGIGAVGMSWYHMGKFDNKGVFHLDREAITAKVRQDTYLFRICPALDLARIKRGLMLLPDSIDPRKDKGWIVRRHYTGVPMLEPAVQYKTISSETFKVNAGQFSVDIGVTARMLDYGNSVSPQFAFVLAQEAKEKTS